VRKADGVQIPDVQYARSGDVAIAYQVVGDGPLDIVFVRGTLADLLAAWDQPLFVDHVEGLARSGRVLLFDKRGSGLSDPVRQVPTLETRMDDIRAVMDAAGSERAVLWAAHEGTRIALLFAATYPERTDALVLYDPTARGLWAPDYPWAASDDDWRRELRTIGERWGDRRYLSERILLLAPSRADDAAFVDWFVWYMRRSASPAEAVAFHRMSMEGDVREVLPAVRTPALVLHRTTAREEAAFVAAQLAESRRVEVEGLQDWFSWADPAWNAVLLDETQRLLEGLSAPPRADRSSPRCSSRTSSAQRTRPPSSAMPVGAASSIVITHSSGPNWRGSAARRSTRLETASSPRSTGPVARSNARSRSARPSRRSGSRSAPVSTPGSASAWTASSAASLCRPAHVSRHSPLPARCSFPRR
jgi:pimeloyl-ACP methyl ester carboxylesterase